MNVPGFTVESLETVANLLFVEQPEPFAGECDQKQKKQSQQTQRTPAQQAADAARGQQQRGKDTTPSATRSEAAKKAAETRRRCKGLPQKPTEPQSVRPR